MRITLLVLGLLVCLRASGSDSLRLAVAKTYYSQIGVVEATGRNDGTQVEAYLSSVGFAKGAPWCAAFVSWVFQQHNVPNAKSAWSPAWFPRSRTIWTQGKGQTPLPADVFGIYFVNLKRIGHVGFIDSWGSSFATTIEGNTNLAGSREGDGVYRKRRSIKQIYKISRWV
jgi:hypothetical protein